ncbi:MAG: PAS domain S-box protein [candidate division Zixibacteria bacterium]|nr:PAS domain S-box protein [candidate division Zixibacteria bacterium]
MDKDNSGEKYAARPLGLAEGSMISQYEILSRLAWPGPQETYLVEDNALGRIMVLRLLPVENAADEVFKSRFVAEIQAMASLRHPNVATVNEISRYEERPFYVLGLGEGRLLSDIIAGCELSADDALEIAIQIAESLKYTHGAEMLHKGLSPATVFVDPASWVRLFDFGLAFLMDSRQSDSADSLRPYAAPELIAHKRADNRSDIYSLGMLLRAMVSGRRQLTGDNPVQSLPAGSAVFAESLGRLIDRAVMERPEDRYQYIDDFLADLKKLQMQIIRRNNEAQFRSLTDDILDSSWDGICILDPDFRIVWMNRALERYLGLHREDVVGSDMRHLVEDRIKHMFEHPEDVSRKLLATYENNTYIEHFECHIIPEGKWHERWLEHWSQPIRSGPHAGGRIEHYTDITERKKAERALRLTQYSVDHAADPVFWLGPDARFFYVNEGACRVLGYTREELLSLTVHDIDPNFPAERWEEHWYDIKKRGSKSFESHHRTKDGQLISVAVTVNHIEFDGREYHCSFARDLSDRDQADQALRESQRALATLMSNLPGIAYRCMNDRDWTMEFVSEGCKELTGYDAADLVHNAKISYAGIIHADDQEYVWDEIQAALAEDHHYQLNYRIITKEGRLKWVWEQGCGVYSEGGTLTALEGFITDISDRIQIEDTLRKTTHELRSERETLTEKNIALKQILDHIEGDRKDYRQQICSDVEHAIVPFLRKLKERAGEDQGESFEALETDLKAVLAKDIDIFRDRYARLTPRELEVCDLIKNGLSSKQISDRLNLSPVTVHKHREQIRKKLGITNKRVNLSRFLRSH